MTVSHTTEVGYKKLADKRKLGYKKVTSHSHTHTHTHTHTHKYARARARSDKRHSDTGKLGYRQTLSRSHPKTLVRYSDGKENSVIDKTL